MSKLRTQMSSGKGNLSQLQNSDGTRSPVDVDNPLDQWRKQASFCSGNMRCYFEDPKISKLKDDLFKMLEKDPLFNVDLAGKDMSSDEKFQLADKVLKRATEYGLHEFVDTPEYLHIADALGMIDFNGIIQFGLQPMIFGNAIKKQSTYPEIWEIADKSLKYQKVRGSIVITEIGHGSNTKGLRTTATYDPTTEEFVINTPDYEAMKCWPGLLGYVATHGLVFAQLYTPDGICHGLHTFLVQFRSTETMLPLKGITIGALGPKGGGHFIDNGFISFDNVRIPRIHLMNEFADVTADGRYITKIKDERQRFAAQLRSLSGIRARIGRGITYDMLKALIIAVRYSAVRKQFGPPGEEEMSILEYQLQQWRLLPYIAAYYASMNFATEFVNILNNYEKKDARIESDDSTLLAQEIHALSSAIKSVLTHLARDCVQECREACGGNGILDINRLVLIRGGVDCSCTYEGDNNVLLGQVSNYLVASYAKRRQGPVSSPLKTVDFINNLEDNLKLRGHSSAFKNANSMASFIRDAYLWLVSFVLKESAEKLQKAMSAGKDHFTARNECQVYYYRTLAIAYLERNIVEEFFKKCFSNQTPQNLRYVLQNLFCLYGLWALEKHQATLYQGGFFRDSNIVKLLRESILTLCDKVKPDAVALVEVFAPPDWVIVAPIGQSNGQALRNFYEYLISDPKRMERISWWKQALTPPIPSSKKLTLSKL